MSKNLTSNIIEDDDFNNNAEETDYKNLIARLKNINLIITLLGKTIFR